MITEINISAVIAILLEKEMKTMFYYEIDKLNQLARKIEQKYPSIRIDDDDFVYESIKSKYRDSVTISAEDEIIVNKEAESTKWFIRNNKPCERIILCIESTL